MSSNATQGQNIVSLADYRGAANMSVLKQVEAYWEGLRNGRVVPLRSEIDPRGIEAALDTAFILERIAPGLARFRLAGMHLVDLMGMEVRGMPLTAFFVPGARKQVSEVLEAVFSGPETAKITLQGETGIGKPSLSAQMLFLPLKSDMGDVSRVLGCLTSDGKIGRAPRRFDVTGVQQRLIGSEAHSMVNSPEVVPGFAESQASFAPGKEGERRHLRLVKTDEQNSC